MVQLEVMRSSDFGTKSTETFMVNSHLGEIINYNDTILAYDLKHMNMVELEEYEDLGKTLPDVVVVRKTYPKIRKR